jgi:hypothetical protein
MKTIAGAALLFVGLIASLIGAPSAVAGPELDFCRDMAAVGYPGDCATLVGLRDVCAQYDRGLDWQTVLQGLDRATKVSNYIIAGAPMYFCPEHDDKT